MQENHSHGAQSNRVCPTCATLGSCSHSHVRTFGEQIAMIFVPFIRPFRCYICNWRGMMGTLAIVPGRTANLWLNGAIFGTLIIGVIYLFAHFMRHPE